MYSIDLDSAYLGRGEPLDMAYYLLKNPYIKSLPEKYKTTESEIVIPSSNTDLFGSYYHYLKELGMPD